MKMGTLLRTSQDIIKEKTTTTEIPQIYNLHEMYKLLETQNLPKLTQEIKNMKINNK